MIEPYRAADHHTISSFTSACRTVFMWLCAGLLIGLYSSPLSANNGLSSTPLPDLGIQEAVQIDPPTEKALGQQWLRALRGNAPIEEDPLVNDYVEHLVYSLVPHSELDSSELELVVVDNPQINAFAVPGGIVGINTGLILSAAYEDEVASVIAHELAHLSQKHFLRRVSSMKKAQTVNIAGILGAVALALAGAPADASVAAVAASRAAAIDSILRHSRAHEQEADRIGMATLLRSNRNPHAMPKFFQTLHEKYRFSSRPPEFLLTHPITESRISDAKNRLRNVPNREYAHSVWFRLIRARLQAQNSRDPAALAAHLEEQFKMAERPDDQMIVQYAAAMAWVESAQPERSIKLMRDLVEAYPSAIILQYSLAEALMKAEKPSEAQSLIGKALKSNPNNLTLALLSARIHLQTKQFKEALASLEPLTRTKTINNPNVWQVLAEASGKTGDAVNAHRYNAERLFATGRYNAAIGQLQLALPLSDNPQIIAKIKTRMSVFKQASIPVEL